MKKNLKFLFEVWSTRKCTIVDLGHWGENIEIVEQEKRKYKILQHKLYFSIQHILRIGYASDTVRLSLSTYVVTLILILRLFIHWLWSRSINRIPYHVHKIEKRYVLKEIEMTLTFFLGIYIIICTSTFQVNFVSMWIATIAGKQLLAEQSHFSDIGIKSFLKLHSSFYIPLWFCEIFSRDTFSYSDTLAILW